MMSRRARLRERFIPDDWRIYAILQASFFRRRLTPRTRRKRIEELSRQQFLRARQLGWL